MAMFSAYDKTRCDFKDHTSKSDAGRYASGLTGKIANEFNKISPRKLGRFLLHGPVHVHFRDATHGPGSDMHW
jgi:hypothetical protein